MVEERAGGRKLELDDLQVPFQHKAFYDVTILFYEFSLKNLYSLFLTHKRNHDCTRLYVLTLLICGRWKVNVSDEHS